MKRTTYDKIRLTAQIARNVNKFTDVPLHCDFINRDLYMVLKLLGYRVKYYKGTFKTDYPMEYMYPDIFDQKEIDTVKFMDNEEACKFPHYFIKYGKYIIDAACYQFNRAIKDRKYYLPAINITEDHSRYSIEKEVTIPSDQLVFYKNHLEVLKLAKGG